MRNTFAGVCYRCGTMVNPGAGHFERLAGRWRVQHAECAIEHRGQPDAARQAETAKKRVFADQRLQEKASGTGKAARKARYKLRSRSSPHPDDTPPARKAELWSDGNG